MLWFEELMGFEEETPEQVRSNIEIIGNQLHSTINGQSYQFGELEIPTLAELRKRVTPYIYKDNISINEEVGNVQDFHTNPSNGDALFQAASQFNLLEMTSPSVLPERGVGIYQYDRTQGPACAIACGAGTIYRNYFVRVNEKVGQSKDNQVNCLEGLEHEWNNEELNLWTVKNGYALATTRGLEYINKTLFEAEKEEWERFKGLLRIGIQWNTEVTIGDSNHPVSQIYCSGLPINYSQLPVDNWELFARMILEATYEATLLAGLENYEKTGNRKVFLTLVGGGVFGNKMSWIKDAINKSLSLFKTTPLEITFISYGGSNSSLKPILNRYA